MGNTLIYLFLSILCDIKIFIREWFYKKIDRTIVRLVHWRGMEFKLYTLIEWAKKMMDKDKLTDDIKKSIEIWNTPNPILADLVYKDTNGKEYVYKYKRKKKLKNKDKK
jgi:hypothetical protein